MITKRCLMRRTFVSLRRCPDVPVPDPNTPDHRPLQDLRLRDFRCFRGEHTARLAPLTLLVGDNGAGKTSFLAAVHAILDVADGHGDPDFQAAPYDLGPFAEVVHRQRPNGRGPGADSFGVGCRRPGLDVESVAMDATFTIHEDATPTLSTVDWRAGDAWMRQPWDDDFHIEFGCGGRSWRVPVASDELERFLQTRMLDKLQPTHGEAGGNVTDSDRDKLLTLLAERNQFYVVVSAEEPIFSGPIRTYDRARMEQDPRGSSLPAFLAGHCFDDTERWARLKRDVEAFGRASGLFDEIFVKHLNETAFHPFQLEVRKWGTRRKGAKRNLIDAGYGVSQVLPLLVDLVYPGEASLFLLQQPEVHLHPRAQAELGSLFCTTAAAGRQIIVETHSDYVIDRVRMDVRDQKTALKPEDVSVLFFERDDLESRIHSVRFDELGNVLDAPHSYGRFFMNETRRSVGL